MSKLRHAIFLLSAITCIFFGILRFSLCLLQRLSSFSLGESLLHDVYLIILTISACLQLFAGLRGILYRNKLEDVFIVERMERSVRWVLIFDITFLISGIILNFLFNPFIWHTLLLICSLPSVTAYKVITNRISGTGNIGATGDFGGTDNISATGDISDTGVISNIDNNTNIYEKSQKFIKPEPIKVLVVIIKLITAFFASIIFIIFLFIVVIIGGMIFYVMRENTPLEEAIPWGIWESQCPPMMLFIDHDYRVSMRSYFTYPVLYKSDEGEVKLFVSFDTIHDMKGSFRPNFMDITGWQGAEPRWHSRDEFQVVDGILHVNTHRQHIVFSPVAYYSPINLDYWRH